MHPTAERDGNQMTSSAWPMPAQQKREDGEPRRVGIEVELQGIPVAELAALAASTLDGEVQTVSMSEFAIDVPSQGRYRVEVDFELLKEVARAHHESGREEGLERLAVEMLQSASSLLVPCEVITPPLAMAAMPKPLDDLVDAIRRAGGQGTHQSPLYAFGVHLNIDPPELSPGCTLAFMRAFVCLFDWIVWRGDIDLSRRLTPYIQRFPRNYEDLLLAADYAPDWDRLIDDYLDMNPTRNRALDMLPLFGYVDEARVCAAVDDNRLRFRPGFHYRLANSCVDEPGWSIAQPWGRWVEIERLAADEERLAAWCAAYREDRKRMLASVDNQWREKVDEWLAAS